MTIARPLGHKSRKKMQGLSSQLRETTVEVESSGLCTVLLARPERGNGYTQRMADELDWIFRAANADDAVKVVVLAGQGSRFCVGVDLGGSVDGAAADTMNTGQAERDVGGVASLSVYHCRKPVIAALHGAAIGIGITVALPCDIRIAEGKTDEMWERIADSVLRQRTASLALPLRGAVCLWKRPARIFFRESWGRARRSTFA